jgi:peptidoglycan/LPS O-acetylase OafA/YrhL
LSAGALGLGITAWHGLDGLPVTSPVLFAYRLGHVASVGGLLLAVPPRVLAWTVPIGRASLTTYVLHLPLLYGWGRSSGLRGVLGESLSPLEVAVLAGLLVLLGSALTAMWRVWRRPLDRRGDVSVRVEC